MEQSDNTINYSYSMSNILTIINSKCTIFKPYPVYVGSPLTFTCKPSLGLSPSQPIFMISAWFLWRGGTWLPPSGLWRAKVIWKPSQIPFKSPSGETSPFIILGIYHYWDNAEDELQHAREPCEHWPRCRLVRAEEFIFILQMAAFITLYCFTQEIHTAGSSLLSVYWGTKTRGKALICFIYKISILEHWAELMKCFALLVIKKKVSQCMQITLKIVFKNRDN